MLRQQTLLRLLLIPSFMSGFLTVFVTCLVLGYSGWLFLKGDNIFYNYLFGAYGLHTFIWQQSSGLSAWSEAFLSGPLAYYMLVGGAATAVGVAIFTLLHWIGMLKSSARELIQDVASQQASRKAAASELLERMAIRAVSVIAWAIFSAFFVSSIIPFAIVLNQVGVRLWAEQGNYGLGFGVSGLALLLLALTLHMHIVFARLCFLRPRIFNASSVIEEAEAASRIPI